MKPHEIEVLADRLLVESRAVPGHLADKEARFLSFLAACVPPPGVILEIGSFKGKSTTLLAKASAAVTDDAGIVAIDPLTCPSSTDPDLDGLTSSREAFFSNLERASVRDRVELHEMCSRDAARTWRRPIRLLWIDGDHTFDGATADVVNFAPHLVTGGVIAMHDVMHEPGVTRVFINRVLRSSAFGASGVVGSIGWAQRRSADTFGRRRRDCERLAGRIERWLHRAEGRRSKTNRLVCRFMRSRVPHGAVTVRALLERLKGGGDPWSAEVGSERRREVLPDLEPR